MRDIKRFESFYDKLKEYHKMVPDLRFMQLIVDFIDWHKSVYGTDGFYLEDSLFLDRFKSFMKEIGVIKDE